MGFFGSRVVLVRWTAALLVISTFFFAAAVLMEGSDAGHQEPTSIAAHDEAAEADEQAEIGQNEAGESLNAKQDSDGAEAGETILGIDLENPWLVWGFVGVSLLLAAAVVRVGTAVRLGNTMLLLAILLAGIAAVLDGREVFLQLGRANVGVAGLASLTALTHAGVVILAMLAWQAVSPPTGRAIGKNTQ